jgi:hypothetical protein
MIMRTFKNNVVVLDKMDRIEVKSDDESVSLYFNPSEGELVIRIGDVEIVGNTFPTGETQGVLYFPRDRAVVAPNHSDDDALPVFLWYADEPLIESNDLIQQFSSEQIKYLKSLGVRINN